MVQGSSSTCTIREHTKSENLLELLKSFLRQLSPETNTVVARGSSKINDDTKDLIESTTICE